MTTTATDTPVSAEPTPGIRFESTPEPETTKEAFKSKISELREAVAAGENPFSQEAGAGPEEETEEKEEVAEPDAAGTDAATGEDKDEPEVEEPEVEEPTAELTTVTLPAVRDGDEPLEIDVEGEDVARRLQELANNGLRRRELNKQLEAVESQRAELDYIGNELETDPVTFIGSRCNAALQVDVVKYLISNMAPEQFEQVAEAVAEFSEDPRERELTGHKLDRERREKREKLEQDRATQREQHEAAGRVVDSIEGLIPDSADDRTADRFVKLAVEEIQEYARAHKLNTLDPERVPVILEKAGILKMFGFAPSKTPAKKAPATTPAAATKPDAADKAKAKAGGEEVKKRLATRKAATALAPVGTSDAPANVVVPKHLSGQERINWLRQNKHVLPNAK